MGSPVQRIDSRALRAATRSWPRVLAESVGLRAPDETQRPAADTPLCHDTWHQAHLAGYWLGQATTLLRLASLNILTDPTFAERTGLPVLGRRIGRRRSTELPATPDTLPDVDVVVLSHAHLDHWDRDALRAIASPRVAAVIPRKTRRLLPRGFGKVIELHWQEQATHEGLTITAVKPRHWGARFLWDRHRGYNAYLLEDDNRRVFFAGDTAHTREFDTLAQPEAPIDLAVFGIGNAYPPWDRHHATPEQAADMARAMHARLLMPIHHATFRDPVEPIDEPLQRLLRVWQHDRLVCARVGEWWCEHHADA